MKRRTYYIQPEIEIHLVNLDELLVDVRVSGGETSFEPPAKENLWDEDFLWDDEVEAASTAWGASDYPHQSNLWDD